jgi:YesN/AraC family two-component response regulator
MAAIEQEPVDLLLTDVIMPETSGRQLAEQVVAKYPETRVLYVSGYTGETLVESGQFPPGSRLLQKPVTLGSLLRAVKEVLAETSSGKHSRVAAASAGSAGQ